MSWIAELQDETAKAHDAAAARYFELVARDTPTASERAEILRLLTELGRSPRDLAGDAQLAGDIRRAETTASTFDERKVALDRANEAFDKAMGKVVSERQRLDEKEANENAILDAVRRSFSEAQAAGTQAAAYRQAWQQRMNRKTIPPTADAEDMLQYGVTPL